MFATTMPCDEFRQRRERLFDTVGSDAAVLLQGGQTNPAHALFRQTNDFFYLCGVEVAHAYLLLDARDRVSRLFLPHQSSEQAARAALVFQHHMSHPVGMSVHDVGHYRGKVIEPGVVFALDPQMRVPEERLYIRVEDTVAFTADGIENFTWAAPLELDDVEKIMLQQGMLQRYPADAFQDIGAQV